MATFTSARGARSFPVPGPGYASNGLLIHGFINVAADPADGDIYEMCRLPAKSIVLGGWFAGSDIDTGTEAVDIDLGWAANGAASAATFTGPDGTEWTDTSSSADPDGFVNSGVLTGDAITDLVAAGVFYRPIILGKPLYFDRTTVVQAEANAAAGTFTAGNMQVVLHAQVIG